MNCQRFFIFLSFIFIACSSNDTEDQKKQCHKIETITRSDKDEFYPFETPQKNTLALYPFEEKSLDYYKITKEFFRCKGQPLNPERVDSSNKDIIKVYLDCESSAKHGLPLINGGENVYPILVDILNYIQRQTKKRVVITCGHRCPKHNSYADISNSAKNSKHMIGAEVDFYVQGLENSPQKIIDLIFDYYKTEPKYRIDDTYTNFLSYKNPTDVSTPPWYNKEIFIKLNESTENRDFNNRHPYPYITIQVIFDRATKQKVNYSWEKAHRGYLQ